MSTFKRIYSTRAICFSSMVQSTKRSQCLCIARNPSQNHLLFLSALRRYGRTILCFHKTLMRKPWMARFWIKFWEDKVMIVFVCSYVPEIPFVILFISLQFEHKTYMYLYAPVFQKSLLFILFISLQFEYKTYMHMLSFRTHENLHLEASETYLHLEASETYTFRSLKRCVMTCRAQLSWHFSLLLEKSKRRRRGQEITEFLGRTGPWYQEVLGYLSMIRNINNKT